MKNKLIRIYTAVFSIMLILGLQACEDKYLVEITKNRGLISSYQFEVDPADWRTFSFTDYSEGNPVSWAWNFGDGEGLSTEQSPTYSYTDAGTYMVVLTTTDKAGNTDDYSKKVIVTDPDAFVKQFTGETSKTWIFQREGTAAIVGPYGGGVWWAWKDADLANRTCVLDDEYTFHFVEGSTTGKFVNDTKGTFFLDATANGGWKDGLEGCQDESTAGIWVSDGSSTNLSDYANGGNYTYTIDPQKMTITLNGSGTYIGFNCKTNNGDLGKDANPPATTVFEIRRFAQGDIADTLHLAMPLGDAASPWGQWEYFLLSFHDPANIPDMPSVPDLEDKTPTQLFNTFASTDPADVVDLVPTESAVTLTVGVEDPADAGAAKVGMYVRGTSDPYADLKFQLDYDCQFDNFSTVSIDIYFPTSNDYSGSLSQQVDIFIADASEDGGNFWQSWENYQETTITDTDTWVTVTFDISTAKARQDLDLIGLKIGGEGHNVDGTFYIRNFRFNP